MCGRGCFGGGGDVTAESRTMYVLASGVHGTWYRVHSSTLEYDEGEDRSGEGGVGLDWTGSGLAGDWQVEAAMSTVEVRVRVDTY